MGWRPGARLRQAGSSCAHQSDRKLNQKIAPTYPESAKKAHIQGQVLVNFVVDKDGNVTDVQPKSGPPELIPAATDAVRQWRYRPYLLLGRPLIVDSTAAINFTLSGRNSEG